MAKTEQNSFETKSKCTKMHQGPCCLMNFVVSPLVSTMIRTGMAISKFIVAIAIFVDRQSKSPQWPFLALHRRTDGDGDGQHVLVLLSGCGSLPLVAVVHLLAGAVAVLCSCHCCNADCCSGQNSSLKLLKKTCWVFLWFGSCRRFLCCGQDILLLFFMLRLQ